MRRSPAAPQASAAASRRPTSREGASVALLGRNAEKGEKVLSELGAGDRAIFIAGDVMKNEETEAFVDQAKEHFGKLDILVNNAGGAAVLLPTVDMPFDDWAMTFQWNLHSTFVATKRALPGMIEQGFGRVINISSVEGKVGKPVVTAYVAAKHAINGFTKAVAKEVGTTGVTVNALCPGLVITDIVKDNGPNTAAAMGITFDEMVDLFAAGVRDQAARTRSRRSRTSRSCSPVTSAPASPGRCSASTAARPRTSRWRTFSRPAHATASSRRRPRAPRR